MTRSLTLCFKMTRPHLIVLATLSTWVVTRLSGGPNTAPTLQIVAPVVMALSVLGASLYHFGAANAMYAKKNEALAVRNPWGRLALIIFGLVGILVAVVVTFHYLNRLCQAIVVVDATIVVFYARVLSRHWRTKNLPMAFVDISPLLLGWFCVGYRPYPGVPYGASAAFFAYLAREIVKDVQDIEVDRGFRATLPLYLGVALTRVIAGGMLLLTLVSLGLLWTKLPGHSWYVLLVYLGSVWSFLSVVQSLFFRPAGQEAREIKEIMLGSGWLLLTFFLHIL